MTDISVREIAADALTEILEEGRFCHSVLARTLDKYAFLPRQDRAFLKRLVGGTVECRIRLDYILDSFSSVRVKKMKPFIRTLLRMSVYQIFEMDRVPDSAVCNEAVKLAAKRGFKGLTGFVNGVLRNISRNKDTVVFPTDEIRYSVPAWIIERFTAEYGEDSCRRMLESFSGESRVFIRLNTGKTDRETILRTIREDGADVIPVSGSENMFILAWQDSPERLRAFREGMFTVQDYSSSLAGEAAGIKPGDTVLDVCGAPGGKALHAADILKGTGRVIVRDLTEEKAERIRENIARSGWRNVTAEVRDAEVFDPSMESACDIVIADLPCSGLGVIGRKPDIRYHASPEGIRELAEIQRRILAVVQRYVKPGGTLVYSTCTVTREENTDNFRWFAGEFPFTPVDITERFPEELRRESMKSGFVQLLPGIDPCDGFFISVFRRQS
ncbi:MAG: 16S rRNA (cytosine(967)-C(5))-methyltransferase RsmB [Clostridium sp.]|nr:16S rRNA (cytosine(967)-C(5))-methyltransferase RsmB [Clostridium sp.]